MSVEDLRMLKGLKSTIAAFNLPGNVRPPVLGLTSSTEAAMDSLDQLGGLLSAADALLAGRQLAEAMKYLDSAPFLLGQANRHLGNLEYGTSRLVEIAPALIRTAPDLLSRLQRYLELLGVSVRGYEGYLTALQELASVLEQGPTLEQGSTPTALTFDPLVSSVQVGSELPVSVRLTALDQGLPNRRIYFYIDEQRSSDGRTLIEQRYLANDLTGEDGTFQGTIPIPFVYVPSAHLEVRFTPLGDDLLTLLAASAATDVALEFSRTTLRLSGPAEAYPGRSFALTLEVAPAIATGEGQRAEVSLGKLPLASLRCTGRCETQITLPPNVPLGDQQLDVTILPLGVNAGVSAGLRLRIVLFPTRIELQAPSWSLVPGEIEVRGRVASAIALSEQDKVIVRMGTQTHAIPVERGVFETRLDLPFSFIAAGPQRVEVSYAPKEPWLQPASASATIFLVNSGNIGLLAVSLAVAVLALLSRRRALQQYAKGLSVPINASSDIVAQDQAALSASAIIRVVYLRVLRLIERMLLLNQEPGTTLREYLARVEGHLGALALPFRQLTHLVEIALYSRHAPQHAEAREAEALAKRTEDQIANA